MAMLSTTLCGSLHRADMGCEFAARGPVMLHLSSASAVYLNSTQRTPDASLTVRYRDVRTSTNRDRASDPHWLAWRA
ncbi:hypothetical protein C8T65DRAFT_95928 [Cerioporus squamosus]|nr:hypothetical protein C8T65DRAFT_95928 [Cerioporus squamosus]